MINPYADGLCFYHALLEKAIPGLDPYIRMLKQKYRLHTKYEDRMQLALELRSMVHENTVREVRRILGKKQNSNVLNSRDTNFLYLFSEHIGALVQRNTKSIGSVKNIPLLKWVEMITQYRKIFLGSTSKNIRTWAHAIDMESAARMLNIRIHVNDKKNVTPYGTNRNGVVDVYLLLDCKHFQAYNNVNEFTRDSKRPKRAANNTSKGPINLTKNDVIINLSKD